MNMNKPGGSTKKHYRLYDALFVLLIFFLIAFKLHDVYLPCFWDELGVYAQSADYQYHHGLSLLPSSVPPDISRGHPLLFTFLNASAFKIFGEHVFVLHYFCLFVSILLILAVYIKATKYFGQATGIIGVVILIVQPLFLAQSAMGLPEVMLALFIFLGITSYFEENFIGFMVFAALAILTKESAVVVPAAVLCYSILQWILFRSKPVALRSLNIIYTLVPYGAFGVFLIIQKQQNGWYFFPYHIGSLVFDPKMFISQFKTFMGFIVLLQGRNWLIIVIPVAIMLALLTNKLNKQSFRKSFLLLSVIFMLAFLCFCSISIFFMGRYITVLLIPVSIIAAAAITSISENKIYLIAIALFIFGAGFVNLESKEFDYDNDLGFRRQVNVLQSAVNYVAENSKKGEKVSGNFPCYFALCFPPGGYLTEKKSKDYMIFDAYHPDYFFLANPGDEASIDNVKYEVTPFKNFKDSFAEVTVYRFKKR